MRNVSLLFLVALAIPAGAQQSTPTQQPSAPFEGEIDLNVESPRTQGPQQVRVHAKGNRLRFALPAGANLDRPVEGIVDSNAKKMMLVLSSDQAVIIADLSRAHPTERMKQHTEQAETSWSAQDTNQKEQIAGRSCEVWRVQKKDSQMHIDACVATDGPRLELGSVLPYGFLPEHWSQGLQRAEIPLRVTSYDDQGNRVTQMQVTSVQMHEVNDNVFTPPAGYKQIQWPLMKDGNLLVPGFLLGR